MPFEDPGRWSPAFEICHYGMSKLPFRGPKRSLTSEYVAFLGSTETYGKWVDHPFPSILEQETGVSCINLGLPNAGIDVMLSDPGVSRITSQARVAVVQVPCAANLTNAFFTVHPRRNDRFLRALDPLRGLYPDVDFTEFHFTRHLLAHLREVSGARFLHVQAELAALWVSRLRQLIKSIPCPVVLLWFSDRRPDDKCLAPDLRCEPALVSQDMLNAVTPMADAFVSVSVAGDTRQRDPDFDLARKVFSSLERATMRDVPGQIAHNRAADVLLPTIADLLDP